LEICNKIFNKDPIPHLRCVAKCVPAKHLTVSYVNSLNSMYSVREILLYGFDHIHSLAAEIERTSIVQTFCR